MGSIRIVQRVARRFLAARRRPLDPEKMTKLLLWVRKHPKFEKPLKELWPVFDLLHWKIEPIRGGTKFTDPAGSTFETEIFFDSIDSKYPFLIRDSEGVSLDTWMSKNHFYDQVLEALKMESYEAEVERKRQDREERARVGKATCPCCFGAFMLTPKAKNGDRSMPGMVLHGYRRPGVGYLQGECFGNGWPPFELSSEGSKAYLVHLGKILEDLKDGLGKLERDDQDILIIGLNARKRDETDPLKWRTYLKACLEQQAAQIQQVTRVISLVQKKLSSWEQHPERLGV